jgi:hypothetical protein
VNVTSDANNCGACGHSCAGETCQGGYCTPTYINSTAINGQIGGVAIDSSYVYFTTGTDDHVGRCPLAGCPTSVVPTWVLTLGTSTGALAYDASTTMLYVSSPSTIYSVTTTGTIGSINYTIPNQSATVNFTTDASLLYWGSSNGIGYANKTTGASVGAVPGGIVGPVCGVWYDPGTSAVFGAECNNSGRIDKCAGGSCTFVSTSASAPFHNPQTVLVQGSTLYFGAGGGGPDGMYTAPAANPASNVQEFAYGTSYAEPTALATDGSKIYFASLSGSTI